MFYLLLVCAALCLVLLCLLFVYYNKLRYLKKENAALTNHTALVTKNSSIKIQVFARLGNILSSSFERNRLLSQIISDLSSFYSDYEIRIVLKTNDDIIHRVNPEQISETDIKASFNSLNIAARDILREKNEIWSKILDEKAQLSYVYSFPLLTDEQVRGYFLVCLNNTLEAGDYHFFSDIASLISSVLQNILTEKEKDYISEQFGRSVDPRVRDYLLSAKEEGKVLNLSVLFFDIRNFTSLSESLGPVTTVALLNEVFTLCDDIIRAQGGFINKFTGDGFMAVFGAPLSTPNHEKDAVHSALKILENVSIDCGIGIASGEAVAGTIGSSKRKEYTVIGDTVNTASRIEGLCKVFGSSLLVSGETLDRAQDCITQSRNLGPIRLKGKTEPIRIIDLQSRECCYSEEFNAAVSIYYSGDFISAHKLFTELITSYPDDKACSWFYERSKERIEKGESWDGSERMSEK